MEKLPTLGRWAPRGDKSSCRNPHEQQQKQQQQQLQLQVNREEEEKEKEEEKVDRNIEPSLGLPSKRCPKLVLPPSPGSKRVVLNPSRCWAAQVAVGLYAIAVTWALLSAWSTNTATGHGRGRKMPALDEATGALGEGGPSTTTSSRGRVAVCFFGLGRSLRWTVPSIKRRVLGVLREDGFEVDVFVHTYSLLEVNNERAGEHGIQYAPFENDFRILNLTRALVTNQDDLDLVVPNPISLTKYKWVYRADTAPAVIRNVFRAYWSQSMVWSLMAEYAADADISYDAVVLARPDVWFHKDVDLPTRALPLPQGEVFIPDFDTDMGAGGQKNDRFAYGSMAAMNVYMNRLATFADPEAPTHADRPLNSEWVLGRHLAINNITVNTFEFPVTRIRLTGVIPGPDYKRVREVCESGSDPIACEMKRLGYKFPVHGTY